MADAQPPRRSLPTTTTAIPPSNASAMSDRHYDHRADRDWPYAPPLHAAHPHPPPPPPSTRDPRGRSAHDYQPHHHHPHHANYAPAPVDPYAAPAHAPPPRHDLPYARPPPPGAAYPYAQSAPGMTAPPPPHYPYNTYPYAASAPYHGQAPLPPPRTQQQQEPQPPVSAHARAHAQHASTSANATAHARGGSDTTSPATAAAGPASAAAAAAGSAADTWARESPTDARRRPVDAAPAAAVPPRAPHPDEFYARHPHPYYPAADPAYSGYPPPYGWHGPPPPWAAYDEAAAHYAWRYPPGARPPPPPMGRMRGWPSAGEPPYAAELPYAAQYPTDASYPAPSAPYVKPDPDAPYPARGPPSPPPGPSGPPAYAWTAPAAAHEAVHDPSRYAPREPAPLPPPLPPATSLSHAASTPIGTAPAEVARGHNANDRVANGMSPAMPRSRTGSAREGAVKGAAASSSAPTPSTRPPSRAVSGGAAEENEGERPRREYVVLTRDLYRAMEASLQDPANPVFPPGMLRKRWRRLMSSFEYHAKNPAWRTLTWKGCLLYIAPQEDWDAIVLDEYHTPPTDPVARHGLDTPAPHRSVTQTFKQLQRRYQTRRSRAGIPLERVEEIVARCPCNQHPATAATVAADVAAITISTDSPTSAPAPPPRAGGNVSTTTSSVADHDDTQLSPHRPVVPPTQLPAPQPSPRDRADRDHVEPAVPMSPLRHTHHEAPYRTHPSWPVQHGAAGNGTHDPRAYPPSGYSGYPDAPSQPARRYSGPPAHEYTAAEAAAGRAHAHGAGWDE